MAIEPPLGVGDKTDTILRLSPSGSSSFFKMAALIGLFISVFSLSSLAIGGWLLMLLEEDNSFFPVPVRFEADEVDEVDEVDDD
jgi:hypothetical protein